jgi:hypothetical protein
LVTFKWELAISGVEPVALSVAERWISDRRATWEARLDRLGALVDAHPDRPVQAQPIQDEE